MSTPPSSAEPGPDREAAAVGGSSEGASPNFTVANRLGFSRCTVALNATPGVVYPGSSRAGQTGDSAPAGSRGSGKRQVKRWEWVMLALALAAAALVGYGFRDWHKAQHTVEPRDHAQVDKGLPGPAKDTQPLAADVPVVTVPAATNAPLPGFENNPEDAATRRRILELEAEPAAGAASKANATPAATSDLPSGQDLWLADDVAKKAGPGLPAVGTGTGNVASAQQAKPGKTAVPVTREAPVSEGAASCPAELSALELCPLGHK
jgi:hypothetical protein